MNKGHKLPFSLEDQQQIMTILNSINNKQYHRMHQNLNFKIIAPQM